jgi:hypothetical protein
MALFDQLLVKIAQNEPLSPSELEELRQAARAMEETKNAVKSWLQPGSSDPHFGQMRAEGGLFTVAPLGTLYLEMDGYDTPQVIPDDTITPVSFTSSGGQPRAIRWESATPTKIYPIDPKKWYAMIGAVEWEANGNGRRAVTIDAFDSDDVNLGGFTLHSLAPHGTDPDTMPISYVFFISSTDTAYLKVNVFQNSGGDLDMNFFTLAFFEVI